jgi:hypothetical protein
MTGELSLQRVPGGVRVLDAPPEIHISLQVLAEACSHELQVHSDRITLADQVVYQVDSYVPSRAALRCSLLEDRRPEGER